MGGIDFKWPRIIRDPVHNVITFGDNPCDQLLLELINSKEFQRLRRIKQLGMADLVFPGANHSRFAHSIGVMQTTRKLLERVLTLGIPLKDEQKTFILVGALLHDIGHGPFSHAFESVIEDRHERRTLEIIQDPDTDVHQRLVGFHPNFPEQLGMFFDEDWESPGESEIIPSFLTALISSQLDADRFDYLLRDSLATGTEYGRFDRDWIIEHLYLETHKSQQRFIVGAKAFLPTEAYVLARYHMYRTVYFHKTTRAAEVMLTLIFKRFKQLLKTGSQVITTNIFHPLLIKAFQDRISLSDYLELDDFRINEFFKSCAASQDSILNELGFGLLNRKLYKTIEVSDYSNHKVAEFRVKTQEILNRHKADPDYHFSYDTPADTPYKPYHPDADKPAVQIYVCTSNGQTEEISAVSPQIKELTKKYQLLRYYYPERFRSDIQAVAEETLK